MTMLQAAGFASVWLAVSAITGLAVGAFIRAGSGGDEQA
jgi:hypothetical protein